MNPLLNPRIHICPVGFEVDRVILPAKQLKAEHVYLLVHNNSASDKSVKYVEQIQALLKKSHITSEIVYANRTRVLEIVKAVKEIILKHRKSEIFINVASGSKIHAIGCMMGCMIFDDRKNLHPFYAEAEKYPAFKEKEQQTYGVKEVHPLPTFQMQTPKQKLLDALEIIKKDKRIKKSQLADKCIERGLITVNSRDNHEKAKYTALDKNITTPLKEVWGFIDEEKVGKNRYIFLTEDGKLASEFLF